MKKNDVLVGEVQDLGYEGEGIIKVEDKVAFLPFAITGESVRYKVLKVNKNLAYCKVEEVLKLSADRVTPECPVFSKCGGCALMHMKYSKQLDVKRDLIKNCIKKIALTNVCPSETFASKPEFNYRNKLQLPIRQNVDGDVEVGFFAPNSHRLIPIDDCIIHGSWCKKIISAVKEYAKQFSISAYSEQTSKGILRHIVVKKIGEEYIIILVINSKSAPKIEHFQELLRNCFGDKFSLFVNINTRKDNVILGEQFIKICGNDFVTSIYDGITYLSGPQSFMQVNEYVKNELYAKAIQLATQRKDDGGLIIDAYCGAGLLTAMLSKKCKSAIGIEIVPEAIESAKRMAKANNIENIEFICAPCEQALPPIVAKAKPENTVLVLDPPRKGLDKNVLEAIVKTRPRKIVYISCSPQTFARDLGVIGGTLCYDQNNLIKTGQVAREIDGKVVMPSGYKIEHLQGFDMFAQCKGVEVLCSLELIDE